MNSEIANQYKWADVTIIALSIYVLIYLSVLTISGTVWLLATPELLAMAIPLLVSAIVASTSIILTHSIIHFYQTRQVRDLVILLMALDIIILVMTYIITHPILEDFLPFADRNRNRTLIIAMGLSIFPSMLAGSFAGSREVDRLYGSLTLLWGVIIIPLMGLWFLLSPTPVFYVTSPSGGLSGLSPLALILVLVIAFTMLSSLVKYTYEWYKERDRVVMASSLALVFWLYGEVLIVLLTDPLQLAEIVWLGAFTTGFILIAFAMLVTSVLEPRRMLEETVAERTDQLLTSKSESEFYLNMWTHKMGNYLQGMFVYLDMLSEQVGVDPEAQEASYSARELSREATLMNLQVTTLSQGLETSDEGMFSISLAKILSESMDYASSLLNPEEFKVMLEISVNPNVLTNETIPIALLSVISFVVKTRAADELTFYLNCSLTEDEAILILSCPGKEISTQVQDFLREESVILSTSIDFDIFVARTIVDTAGGSMSYLYHSQDQKNQFHINLKLDKS